jgi:glucan phosphoethanolaminetransferase (alkaline phosphatase superfamily)
MQRYNNYKAAGDAALYAAIGEFFLALAFIYPFLYTLSIRNIFFKFLTIFIYVISGLTVYFIYSFKISINSEIIAAFFESSKDECSAFLNIDLILGALGSGLLGWLYILSVERSCYDQDQDKKLSFITIIFTLGCFVGDGDWVNNILPYNILKESSDYFLEKASITEKRFDIASNYNYEIDNINSEDLNIVLIIDEKLAKIYGLEECSILYKENLTEIFESVLKMDDSIYHDYILKSVKYKREICKNNERNLIEICMGGTVVPTLH